MAQTITLDVTEPAKTGTGWAFSAIATVTDDKKKPKQGLQLLFYVNGAPQPNPPGDRVETDEQGIAAMHFDLPKGKYRVEAIEATKTLRSPARAVTLDDTPKKAARLQLEAPNKGTVQQLIIRVFAENGSGIKARVRILDGDLPKGYRDLDTNDDGNLITSTTFADPAQEEKRIEAFVVNSETAGDWTLVFQ